MPITCRDGDREHDGGALAAPVDTPAGAAVVERVLWGERSRHRSVAQLSLEKRKPSRDSLSETSP